MNATDTKALGYRVWFGCPTCKKFLWTTSESYNDVTCHTCHKQVGMYVRKIISIKPEHAGPKCSAKCNASTSGECECSCGGKNHGSAA